MCVVCMSVCNLFDMLGNSEWWFYHSEQLKVHTTYIKYAQRLLCINMLLYESVSLHYGHVILSGSISLLDSGFD
jgi:hypothetical protein